MNKLEVLISAMHQKDMSIAEKTHCTTDVLIINQTDNEGYMEVVDGGRTIRMVSTAQRGISKSRNMALMHAKGDICLLCDDDEVLEEGYEKTILDAYSRNPQADIIAFNYKDLNPRMVHKDIIKEGRSSKWHTFSTLSLSFRRESVLKSGVWFDCRIGTGSGIISAGEETAWQNTAIRKNLCRWEVPETIATVSQETSTWFEGFDEHFFYDKGANLRINHPYLCYILQFYYLMKMQKASKLSMCSQLKWMMSGMKGILKEISYKEYVSKKKREQ